MRKYKLLIIVAICLVLFILLIASTLLLGIDKAANSIASKIQIDFFVQIARVISWLFDTVNIFIISLVISLFLFRNYKKDAIIFSSAMIFSGLLVYILKTVVERARPENAIINETNFSFPSGHALTSLVFFGFLAYFLMKRVESKTKKVLIAVSSGIVIFLIGLSRVYLNVHWLSDVLGGFFLGFFIFSVFLFIRKYILK